MNTRARFVRTACLVLAVCGLSLGCHSGPTVRTSYEPSADFSGFKTFALNHPNHPTPVSGGVDPFMVFRLRQMVYSQLDAQGYSPAAADQAAMLVTVNAEARTRTESVPNSHHAYGYYGSDVQTVDTLLLTIDILDPARQSVIWHGSSEVARNSDMAEADLWTLVQAILARFPPTGAPPE